VSSSLYRKITGIWEERKRLLEKIKEDKAKLRKNIREEKKRLRREAAKFRKQKAHIVKQAVERRTKQLEFKIETLRRREKQIERNAQDKIRKATLQAHAQAQKLAKLRLNSFKRQLRASVRDRLRKERERGARKVESRYRSLKNTFHATLIQMRAKNTQIQEQAKQIRELERQLEKQTTSQLEGYLDEHTLTTALKRWFPEDEIQHKGKGGDVIHSIVRKGRQVGLIVYECKRVKHYSAGHVKQAAEAKEKRKADFAILVTNAMKKGTQGFYTERGVIVVHTAGLQSILNILRSQIIQIAEMKLGQQERDKAIRMTLEYLEGPEFSNSMDSIIQESISLWRDLMREVKEHITAWKKRDRSYKKVHEQALTVKTKSKALLSGEPEYKKLITTDTLPALPELPDLERTTDSPEGPEVVETVRHGVKETEIRTYANHKTPDE
jgi:hypothetical protein